MLNIVIETNISFAIIYIFLKISVSPTGKIYMSIPVATMLLTATRYSVIVNTITPALPVGHIEL
jgi:hypothetical protein